MSTLTNEEKATFKRCYYLFFINGIIALCLGAFIPFIKESYQLDYGITGILLSMHSIGNLVSSFLGGVIPVYIGRKKSSLIFLSMGVIAFFIIPFTANTTLLAIAFFLTGLSRGSNSNFNNAVINEIATGKAWALNLLHGVFSIGAFLAPFMVMIITRNHANHWIYASILVAFLCLTQVILLFFMDVPNNYPKAKESSSEKSKQSFEFLKNKYFLTACGILFFYLCAEQGINGWLITYFKESQIMSETFAQIMAGALWLIILFGRLTTAYFSKKVKKSHWLLFSGCAYVIFFAVLLMARSVLMAGIGIIGVGFSMAGLYPTTVASVGPLIKRYPLSLSFMITFAGIGSIMMPSIIGAVAEQVGIIGGMATLIVAVIITLAFIVYNFLIQKGQETL